MSNDELLEVIEQAARDGATTLNLAYKGLLSLPPEIGNLPHLSELDLKGNYLKDLPVEIGQLTQLNRINLQNNQLARLPEQIIQLTKLTFLELTGNQLSTIPMEVFQLTSLTLLDLSLNRLTMLPAAIKQLANLTSLSLIDNQLTTLPIEIAQLTNLTSLDLSSNQLSTIPPAIFQLKKLSSLNLHHNYLVSLPTEIAQLKNLTKLRLSYNQLTNLPLEIGQLTRLTYLDLEGNKLEELPTAIGQLVDLCELDLKRNRLNGLPIETAQLTKLTTLYLKINPLSSLPPEIHTKSGIEILNFYRQQLEQDIDHLYEAKLLIVGEGGAGKTTLAKKLQDANYQLQSDEVSTEGIDVTRWYFPLQNGREFRVNIWDFGGQEIYHATHQFFLTKRSLYVLVADTRKENTDFYYWLNVVELSSENSPLLIIKNEKQERKREINEPQLRGEFINLKETLATNFATNRGLPEILNKIQHYIQNLPHVGTELPKNWVKVREVLEEDARNYISLDDYFQICKDNGFTRREDALQLSGYLHDLYLYRGLGNR